MGNLEATKPEASVAKSSERNDALSVVDRRTGKTYELPITNGTVRAVDLRQIKTGPDDFGLMSYDPAFLNTASCTSRITFIDGEKGILRYRGYPIEVLAEKCTYLEVAYLLLYGELPNKKQFEQWVRDITYHTMIHESLKKLMETFNHDAHPMGMLIATVAAIVFVAFAASMFVGRLFAGRVLYGVGRRTTIVVAGVGAMVGGMIAVAANDSLVVGLGFLVLGFTLSAAGPAASPSAWQRFPARRSCSTIRRPLPRR